MAANCTLQNTRGVARLLTRCSLALVPSSVAPLCSIHLGEDNLLLSYADKRSRLWDAKTREFWRSMSIEKAGEMIKQGGWMEW